VAVLVEARNLDADNPIIRGRLERLESASHGPGPARHTEPSASARPHEVEIAVEEESGG
jgi:hypothetical protein